MILKKPLILLLTAAIVLFSGITAFAAENESSSESPSETSSQSETEEKKDNTNFKILVGTGFCIVVVGVAGVVIYKINHNKYY